MIKRSTDATVLEKGVIGALAGSLDSLCNHPLWLIKTRLQNNESFTLNPKILSRGISLNILSNVPIAAFQVGFNRYIQQTFFSNEFTLSNKQKNISAFAAGFGSSFIICPTEMIMTWQGKTGYSFQVTTNYLFSQGGLRCFFTGFWACGARDGISSTYLLNPNNGF